MTTKPDINIRDTGDDIPSDMGVAIEQYGNVIGYAADTRAAMRHIETMGNDESSREFFAKKTQRSGVADAEALKNVKPEDVKQATRRRSILQNAFENILNSRVQPGADGSFMYITFEEATKLNAEYQDAVRQKREKECDFQPLTAYHHKIQKLDGEGNIIRKVRDVFVNEYGVWTKRDGSSKILILKDQGPGDVGGKYFAGKETD